MNKTKQSGPGVTPLGDRVLIRELKGSDKKTAGGLIIPESVKGDRGAKRGLVVATGKGRYEEGKIVPIAVKAGDTVLFGWGDEITIDGEEFYLVRESEIHAIID